MVAVLCQEVVRMEATVVEVAGMEATVEEVAGMEATVVEVAVVEATDIKVVGAGMGGMVIGGMMMDSCGTTWSLL